MHLPVPTRNTNKIVRFLVSQAGVCKHTKTIHARTLLSGLARRSHSFRRPPSESARPPLHQRCQPTPCYAPPAQPAKSVRPWMVELYTPSKRCGQAPTILLMPRSRTLLKLYLPSRERKIHTSLATLYNKLKQTAVLAGFHGDRGRYPVCFQCTPFWRHVQPHAASLPSAGGCCPGSPFQTFLRLCYSDG